MDDLIPAASTRPHKSVTACSSKETTQSTLEAIIPSYSLWEEHAARNGHWMEKMYGVICVPFPLQCKWSEAVNSLFPGSHNSP